MHLQKVCAELSKLEKINTIVCLPLGNKHNPRKSIKKKKAQVFS